jgi:hypothetical protein
MRGGECLHRLLLVFGLCCLAPWLASAQDIIIEAETYIASHNEGGNSIVWVSCSAASGGKALEGIDYPGDWIEVSLNVWNGSFTDELRSAGLLDSASVLEATIFGGGPGGSDLNSVFNTYGLGIG